MAFVQPPKPSKGVCVTDGHRSLTGDDKIINPGKPLRKPYSWTNGELKLGPSKFGRFFFLENPPICRGQTHNGHEIGSCTLCAICRWPHFVVSIPTANMEKISQRTKNTNPPKNSAKVPRLFMELTWNNNNQVIPPKDTTNSKKAELGMLHAAAYGKKTCVF